MKNHRGSNNGAGYVLLVIGFVLLAIGNIYNTVEAYIRDNQEIRYVTDVDGGHNPVIAIDAGNSIDLSCWEPSGEMAVYYTENGKKQLLACREIQISVAHHVDDSDLNVEKYLRAGNSSGVTTLVSECYERLDNGTYIEINKWFIPYTDSELESYDDVKISVSAEGVRKLNVDTGKIPDVKVEAD